MKIVIELSDIELVTIQNYYREVELSDATPDDIADTVRSQIHIIMINEMMELLHRRSQRDNGLIGEFVLN